MAWLNLTTTLTRFIPRSWRGGTVEDLFSWLSQGFATVIQRDSEADTIVSIFDYSAQRLSILNELNDTYDPTLRRLYFAQDVDLYLLQLVVPSELIATTDKLLVKQIIKNRVRAGIVLGDITYTNFAISVNISGTPYAIAGTIPGGNKAFATNLIGSE